MTVLREQLLAGRVIALGDGVSPSLSPLLEGLGAQVEEISRNGAREEGEADAGLHAVVHDSRAAFGAGGAAGLAGALQEAWDVVASVANQALIPAGSGKVVLIAPRSGAGRLAQAARAGLENLARTLSIEWARYGITAVAIAPGAATSEDAIDELVAFLLSAAGDYFSGCRFELGAVE